MTPCDRIVRISDTCGGEPIIEGTRIRVADVVVYRQMLGSCEALVNALPPLTMEDAVAALDYYREHPDEVDRCLAEDEASESWDVPNQYRPSQ